MMCFKHLLPYAVLLPIPSASPIFILIFAIQIFYTVRPCGYCLALISILFLSSSPSSPFTSVPPPTETGIPAEVKLNTPVRKTWFDMNNGHFFDPVLHAFRPNATLSSSERSPYDAYHTSTPGGPQVPKDYWDLRYRGLGLVLDFGWTRSEEGVRWEMEDRRQAGGRLKFGSEGEMERLASEREREQEADAEQVDLGQGSDKSSWFKRMLSSVKGGGRSSGLIGDW